MSYANGDHGIDVLNSTNTVVVSNSVYGNVTSGINVEGCAAKPSTGATLRNNISVDSGLSSTTTKGDIRVDVNSTPGTTLDYDETYLSSPGTMVTWGSKQYTTLSALATATGQETHGLDNQNGGDPQWVSPSTGDFHLKAGSRAIDSAASSAPDEPATDFDGQARVDDPSTPDIGIGPRTYDDRGALEYQPNLPPVARLALTPASGNVPLAVSADASASTDDHGIATYAFDFGDGTTTGPQVDPTAQHSYDTAGTFTVTVTVTDSSGKASTATATVNATAVDRPPSAVLGLTPSAGAAPLDVTADASGSTDTDGSSPIASYTFDFGDGSAPVGPQPAATATHTYTAGGSFVAKVTVTDTKGLTDIASASVAVGNTTVDEVHYTYASSTSVAFDWRGGPSTIRYGTTSAYGSTVTGSAPNPMPYSSTGPFWEASDRRPRCRGDVPLLDRRLPRTRPSPREPTGNFRFDAEGDIGDSVTYPNVGTTQGQIATGPAELRARARRPDVRRDAPAERGGPALQRRDGVEPVSRVHAGLGQPRVGGASGTTCATTRAGS